VKKINIVMPVYNEEEVINDFNLALFKVLKTLSSKYTFEVIYVLDKSRDNSTEILKQICDEYNNVKLIMLSKRFGHQMSLVAGMDSCNGDATIMMDSDLEHPPEVIVQLLEAFEQGYDIVHTKRIYDKKVSFFKRITSKLFYKILSKLSSIIISEDSADFRLISKRCLTVMQNNIREQNQFLRGLFHWVGFNQTYVTFISKSREKGKSKYNLTRLINFAAIGIISFSKTPLRISIISGMIISGISILYGFICIIDFFIRKQLPQGWTSLITVVSLLGGFQLIILGIIGEYVGAIFEEVKGRPLYIIEEEYGVKLHE
jgi:polyisoprenyl-phosphate glycosyltransferase